MTALQIKTLTARYHLPPSKLKMLGRLDRLLEEMREQVLELALERCGIGSSEQVCIRGLYAPVRLRLSATDEALMRSWSLGIAEQIGAVLARGDGAQVVRYASRMQALADFASGVALGCHHRAWAWSQLGITRLSEGESDTEAAAQLYATLTREPECVVPVLKSLAEEDRLQRLAGRLRPQWWRHLAFCALRAAGADSEPILSFDSAGVRQESADLAIQASVSRVLSASALAHALLAHSRHFEANVPRAAFLALAALEVEPSLFLRGERIVLSWLAVADQAVRERTQAAVQAQAPDRGQEEGTDRPRTDAYTETNLTGNAQETEQAGVRRSPRAEHEAEAGSASAKTKRAARHQPSRLMGKYAPEPQSSGPVTEPPEEPRVTAHPNDARNPAVSDPEPSPAVATPDYGAGEDAAEADYALPDTRRSGWTELGGLLFLVGILRALGLPEEIARHPLFRKRAMGWVMQCLALRLVATGEDDPAVLAFCGVLPGETPPWRDEPRAHEMERAVIARWARRIVDTLRERLDWEGLDDDRLLDKVCRRPARILADPGWLEVVYSLDDVSLDLRLAALDLDPGYIPWLGVVIKFVYE